MKLQVFLSSSVKNDSFFPVSPTSQIFQFGKIQYIKHQQLFRAILIFSWHTVNLHVCLFINKNNEFY